MTSSTANGFLRGFNHLPHSWLKEGRNIHSTGHWLWGIAACFTNACLYNTILHQQLLHSLKIKLKKQIKYRLLITNNICRPKNRLKIIINKNYQRGYLSEMSLSSCLNVNGFNVQRFRQYSRIIFDFRNEYCDIIQSKVRLFKSIWN